MTNNSYIRQLDPIQGLVDYVEDIKPYHTKIVEVMIEYVYNDDVNSTIEETLGMAWGPSKFPATVVYGAGTPAYDFSFGVGNPDVINGDTFQDAFSEINFASIFSPGDIIVMAGWEANAGAFYAANDGTFTVASATTTDLVVVGGGLVNISAGEFSGITIHRDAIPGDPSLITMSGDFTNAISDGDTITLIDNVTGDRTSLVVANLTYTYSTNLTTFYPPAGSPTWTLLGSPESLSVEISGDVTYDYSFVIEELDSVSQSIIVSGPATADVFNGQQVRVSNTTSNDGDYTIEGSPTFNGLTTIFPVAESLTAESPTGSPVAVIGPIKWWLPIGDPVVNTCGVLTLWSEGQSVFPTPLNVGAEIGYSLAMNDAGTLLLLGAPYEESVDSTPSTYISGAIYAYEDDGFGVLTLIDIFSHTNAGNTNDMLGGDDFNGTISRIIDTNETGSLVVAGAPRWDDGVTESFGEVVIFERVGNSFDQIDSINMENTYPSNGGAGAEGIGYNGEAFGTSVALRGDGSPGSFLFIGSPYEYDDNSFTYYPGYVHQFENIAGTWTSVDRFTAVGEPAGETSGFGTTMRLSRDGNTLAVYEQVRNTGSGDGAVRVYRWNIGTSRMDFYAIFEDGFADSWTDIAVSDDGTRISVACDYGVQFATVWDDNGVGTFTGTQLIPADGYQISCSSTEMTGYGDVVMFGDYFTQGSGSTVRGAVYIYKNTGSGWVEQTPIYTFLPQNGIPAAGYYTEFGFSLATSLCGDVTATGTPYNYSIYDGGFATIIGT